MSELKLLSSYTKAKRNITSLYLLGDMAEKIPTQLGQTTVLHS